MPTTLNAWNYAIFWLARICKQYSLTMFMSQSSHKISHMIWLIIKWTCMLQINTFLYVYSSKNHIVQKDEKIKSSKLPHIIRTFLYKKIIHLRQKMTRHEQGNHVGYVTYSPTSITFLVLSSSAWRNAAMPNLFVVPYPSDST